MKHVALTSFFLMGMFLFNTEALCCEKGGTLEVVGEAQLEAMPDVAVLDFMARYTDKDAKVARSKVEKMVSLLNEKTKTLNLAKDEFASGSLDLYPNYRYTEKNKRVFEGYTCTRRVTFRVSDFSLIEKITSMAMDAGITEINGFHYEIKDTSALEKKADKLAMEDALDKSRRLAEGFGVKIVKTCSLKFGGRSGPVVYRNKSMTRLMVSANGANELEPVEYTPQKQMVESSVYVTFSIE